MSELNLHFPDCLIHRMPQRSESWHEIRKDKLTASQVGGWLAERPECRLTIPEIKDMLDMAGISYPKTARRDELLTLGISVEGAGSAKGEIIMGSIWPTSHLKGTIDARHTAICKILGSMSKCQVPDAWEVDPEGDPPRNPALWAVWNGIRQEPAALAAFQDWHGHALIEVGFCEHKSGVAGCSPDALIYGQPIGFEGKAPMPATHIRYLLDGVLPTEYADQVHFSMAITGAVGWWFQSYCEGLPSFRVFTERSDYTERMVEGIAEFKEHLESARDEIASLWDAEFNQPQP
jgi:hypothetical protein